MDIKDVITKDKAAELLIYNPENYSFIFKKTEKVVCAVFYITESKKDTVSENGNIVRYLQESAHSALEAVLDALTEEPSRREYYITRALKALFRLESTLQVAHASGVVHRDYVDMVTRELEDVVRSIYRLSSTDDRVSALAFDPEREHTSAVQDHRLRSSVAGTVEPKKAREPRAQERSVHAKKGAHADRRSAIRAVLATKGQASIKDVSDIVTDCSEKTIQRELNDMIKDGEVTKRGERRWSRYSIAGRVEGGG